MIVVLKEVECPKCKRKVKENQLKRLPSGIKCVFCMKEDRKKHRDYLKYEVAGVRKIEDLRKEWAEKRKIRKEFNKEPKIRGSKNSPKPRNPKMSYYITKEEKLILWRKFNNKEIFPNLSQSQINERINLICKQMEELVKKLKAQKKSEMEIGLKFKEEFAKLLENERTGLA